MPIWNEFVESEIKVWVRFHQYWLQQARSGLQTYVVRFEDLVNNSPATISSIVQFLESRRHISVYCREGSKHQLDLTKVPGYAPRKTDGNRATKNIIKLGAFRPENIRVILEAAHEHLESFGYEVTNHLHK